MDEAAVDDLRRDFDVVYDPGLVDRPDDLCDALIGADALIVRNRTQVRGAVLNAAETVRVIGRLGVGLDNIDLDGCAARGIEVRPATGANDLAVAEYAVAAAMSLLRGAYDARQAMIAGEWPRTRLMGRESAGKRFGLVGFGAIARETARLARGLGFSLAAHDPFVPADAPEWDGVDNLSLADLAGGCDVVSLHVPLTDGTRHLVDAAFLSGMKPGAVLINAARGGVVDEAALADALRAGRLGGAALDVFETEPLTAAAAAKFDGLPNLILTPHIAGVTAESNVRVSSATARAVREVLSKIL
ncbi:MAG: hydroxyacid dehydrogenase [Alphaproteobacteria bacterium]|nr:hydroxyacid dehydrogenase [Alphaproteobacteria bacterium]MBO6864789.1 hydroxyacid dehydrogenase [Alphaproteobacteria bacterium]